MYITSTSAKNKISELREQFRQEFFSSPSGTEHARKIAAAMDEVLAEIYSNAAKSQSILNDFCLLATGGYGRGILSPYSDIDLVILHSEDSKHEKTDAAVSEFLYPLWDAGLSIGHQVATSAQLCEAAMDDVSTATSLMEARRLAGDKNIFSKFRSEFTTKIINDRETQYVLAKMEECNQRHLRMGESRFLLEPNVKEGKGGLRDLNTLWWISCFARHLESEPDMLSKGILDDDEYKIYTDATDFLLQVRAWMHYITGRAENLLTFDIQREISQRAGYKGASANESVEMFMKNYFNWARKVGELNRTICGVLASEQIGDKKLVLPSFLNLSTLDEVAGFPIENQMLSIKNQEEIIANPTLILKLFNISQQHKVEIHPRLLRFFTANLDCIDEDIRNNHEASNLFMEILLGSSPQMRTLRRMNDCGVLGAFMPEFSNIVGQMQFDLYHTYTVDEHTLNAIGNLATLARGGFADRMPIASQIIKQAITKKSLYVALLLHDVAKGMGGGHSELGFEITKKVAPRLGLNDYETETAAWLVANHLLLTQTAFKRDITDPNTINELAAEVHSLERLKLLLLMTVADITAVGPKIWNGWKGALLRSLYLQTAGVMGGEVAEEENSRKVEKIKSELVENIGAESPYLNCNINSFWLSFSLESHLQLERLFENARKDESHASFEITTNEFHDSTILRLCAPPQNAMLARLSWACAASGLSIISARCFVHNSGMAIASIGLQGFDNKPVTDQKKLKKLKELLVNVTIHGTAVPESKITQPRKSARLEAVQVNESVDIDNEISDSHTVIEITARDRLGLLYDLSRKCSELGLEVHTAHISTYGVKAVDVFYVQDIFGEKITNPDRLELIKASLL